jgi:hypothetical protein
MFDKECIKIKPIQAEWKLDYTALNIAPFSAGRLLLKIK